MAGNGVNAVVFVFVFELKYLKYLKFIVQVERDTWIIIIYVYICDQVETDLVDYLNYLLVG